MEERDSGIVGCMGHTSQLLCLTRQAGRHTRFKELLDERGSRRRQTKYGEGACDMVFSKYGVLYIIYKHTNSAVYSRAKRYFQLM
jgi:hypothetical protein